MSVDELACKLQAASLAVQQYSRVLTNIQPENIPATPPIAPPPRPPFPPDRRLNPSCSSRAAATVGGAPPGRRRSAPRPRRAFVSAPLPSASFFKLNHFFFGLQILFRSWPAFAQLFWQYCSMNARLALHSPNAAHNGQERFLRHRLASLHRSSPPPPLAPSSHR